MRWEKKRDGKSKKKNKKRPESQTVHRSDRHEGRFSLSEEKGGYQPKGRVKRRRKTHESIGKDSAFTIVARQKKHPPKFLGRKKRLKDRNMRSEGGGHKWMKKLPPKRPKEGV